jgi:hypothetical protein
MVGRARPGRYNSEGGDPPNGEKNRNMNWEF